MKYSVIVPVYNRPDEVEELLESLAKQTFGDFEVVIVEDGSTVRCDAQVQRYRDRLDIKYIYKENEGRSIARNVGIEASEGEVLVFFDSDCVIPPGYFETVDGKYCESQFDFYGGPDAAHSSFSRLQRAINFAMTSFITTGGIRGGRRAMEKFVPRTFNMGFSRRVYARVGGFREMFSEDIDMSSRIKAAGYDARLFCDAYVYHKRRGNFAKFLRQVYVFGMSRITLTELYPGSLKAVHVLPALFLVASVAMIVLALVWKWWCVLPLALYVAAVLVTATATSRSLAVGLLAVPASFIQLWGYGAGFLKAWFARYVLGHKRDVNQEIKLRKGK